MEVDDTRGRETRDILFIIVQRIGQMGLREVEDEEEGEN
jgi:hypothetical protein